MEFCIYYFVSIISQLEEILNTFIFLGGRSVGRYVGRSVGPPFLFFLPISLHMFCLLHDYTKSE